MINLKNLNKNSENLPRHSGIELLRIFAMLMIIAHHFALFGLTIYGDGFNFFIARLFQFGGKLGVDIFVIISSYFLMNKKFNIKRFFNIIFQVLFYSILFLIIFTCINKEFSVKLLIINVFPIIFNNYWFITTYLLLYLTFPLLNIIIKNISQNQHKLIIFTFLFFCMFIPQVLSLNYFYNDIIWFITLYFVASYIKLYGIKLSLIEASLLLCFWIIGLITIITGQADIFSQNSFLIFPLSIILFLISKNINFHSKFINLVASSTFGVYLIHENFFIRSWLWRLTKPLNLQLSPYFAIYGILIIISVFIACTTIDLLYKYSVGKLIKSQIDKVINRYCSNQKSNK